MVVEDEYTLLYDSFARKTTVPKPSGKIYIAFSEEMAYHGGENNGAFFARKEQ